MNILLIVVAVVAIVLLFTGGFVSSLSFLLWVGIILLIVTLFVYVFRIVTGRRGL